MISKKIRFMLTSGLLLWCTAQSLPAATNNLHFTGTLETTFCKPVMQGGVLDEVIFPEMAAPDLMSRGQSARVKLVISLTDCTGPMLKNGLRVTFSGTEESSLPGYLALDSSSTASGFAIGLETLAGTQVPFNSPTGTTFAVNPGSNELVLNAWLQTLSGTQVTPGTFVATTIATFEYL